MKQEPLFTGAATALITPFDGGKIDLAAFEKLIRIQIEGGISALVVCGTTGEVPTLSETEQNELIRTAVSAAGGRVPIIAGAGGNCTAKVCALAENAAANGADGILCITPYYNKGTKSGIVRHFEEVAASCGLPVLVYNVPSRTGVELTPELYRELSALPGVVGVKESGGSMEKVLGTRICAGEDFAVYSGNDADTLPILSLGGKGVISVASNLFPREVSRVCSAYFSGDTEGALRGTLRLAGLYSALFSEVNPAPVKYAASLMGICREEYRLPLTECTPETKGKLRRVLANLL